VLPTFVIGLREGLEASLIVGIVAAFLRRNGDAAGLRRMWLGVLAAVLGCLGMGVALDVLAADLPQRQQEGLETVIAVAAVGMVTYMIVWMKNHSRDLKGSLESAAGSALATHSAFALVLMAFLAVLREGLETVVFLLAAFNASGAVGSAALGAALGIVAAMALGYAIYRGGVRVNLSRFFRATGVVLALVAAGLVVSALHTGHEAGWISIGQEHTFSLRWLAEPGSIRASLLTGVLGVQPDPAFLEVIGWLAYVIPVVTIICWPPGVPVPRRSLSRGMVGGAAVSLLAAATLALLAPASPATGVGQTRALAVRQTSTAGPAASTVHAPTGKQTSSGRESVAVRSATPTRLIVRWGAEDASADVTLHAQGSEQLDGTTTRLYTASPSRSSLVPPSARTGWAGSLTLDQLARATNGRLPLGLSAQTSQGPMPITYSAVSSYRIYLDPASRRIVDARRDTHTVAALTLPSGGTATLGLVTTTATAGTSAAVHEAVTDIHHHAQIADRHAWMRVRWPVTLLAVAVGAAAVAWWLRRMPAVARPRSLPRIHHQGATR
jgi:high-affinity iron transporter